MELEKVIKISAKGQITLPKVARERLGTALVRLVLDGKQVRIMPFDQLAGRLKEYGKKGLGFEDERDRAWTEAIRGKPNDR